MRAESKKDPDIIGRKVFAFRNLHTGGVSLRAATKPDYGKTIHHCDCVRLTDCEFRVRESGRQRVIREGVKTVHAGVVGIVSQALDCPPSRPFGIWEATEVRYNPITGPAFVDSSGVSAGTCGPRVVVAADIVVIMKTAGTVKVFAWGVK